MCIKVSKKISISSWNVNGLFRRLSGGLRTSKLDDENFKNCMSSDIGLSETHASSKDILALDGYKCHVN